MLIPQTSVAEEKLFRLFIFQLKPQILLFSVLLLKDQVEQEANDYQCSRNCLMIGWNLPLTRRLALSAEGGLDIT